MKGKTFQSLLFLFILFSFIYSQDQFNNILYLNENIQWNYHINGNIEFVSIIEKNDIICVLANYQGSLYYNNTLLDIPPSEGNNQVTSGLILIFSLQDKESFPILSKYATISTKYYSSHLYLHECEIYKNYIILTGVTNESTITLINYNGTEESKSIVVGSIGNFISTFNIDTGLFYSFSLIPKICNEYLYCSSLIDYHSQLTLSDHYIGVSSIFQNSITNIQSASVVLYQLSSLFTKSINTEFINIYDTEQLNPIESWNFIGLDSYSTFVIKGLSIDESLERYYVSGYTSNGTISITTSNNTECLTLQAVNNEETNFLISLSTNYENSNTIESVNLIHQEYGEYGYQILNNNEISILIISDNTTGFQRFSSEEDISMIQLPLPIIQSIESPNNIELYNIFTDPLSQIWILGNSYSSVVFGEQQNTTMTVDNGENGIFLAKYNENGDFLTVFTLVTSSNHLLSLIDTCISNDGSLLGILNNQNTFSMNQIDYDIGASLIRINSCEDSCSDNSFCDIQSSESICICNPDYIAIGNTCYQQPCPNDCSNHGSCSYESAKCICDTGYLSPDCSQEIRKDVYSSYFNINTAFIGNIYQTTSGSAEILDYTSLPSVGWSFVIGKFSGKVVFGDISNGDAVSETINSADGEVGGFIAMYNDKMELQWIIFIRSQIEDTIILLSKCSLIPNSSEIIVTGYISGQVDTLLVYKESEEILSKSISYNEKDIPQLFARVSYIGDIDWLDINPPCYTVSECNWQANSSLPVFTVTSEYIYISSIGIKYAPVETHAANRAYFMVYKYNLLTSPPSLELFGYIGDGTSTTDLVSITGIELSNDILYISGHFYTYVFHCYNINNQSISYSVESNSSPSDFVLKYSTDFNYITSYISHESQVPSMSLGISCDPLQTYIWFIFIRLHENTLELGAKQFSNNMDIITECIFSIILEDTTNWKDYSNIYISSTVDLVGDILFLTANTLDFTMRNSLQVSGKDSVFIDITQNEISYFLSKYSNIGIPMWTIPINLIHESYDSQVGNFIVNNLSNIQFDEYGKIQIVGSLQQELHVSWDLNLGVIITIDGKYCNGCSNNGWCYYDNNIFNSCMCKLSSLGRICKETLLINFSNYLNWSQSATLISPSINDTIQYYSIQSDTTYNLLYTTGLQRGQANYQTFIPNDLPNSVINLGNHYGDGFISSISPTTGYLYWTAYASITNNQSQSCYITQIEVDKYEGTIFIGGWAEYGTLELFHANGSLDSSSRFISLDIPLSGSVFVGMLFPNGSWNWAEVVQPRDYCFLDCNPDKIITEFWDHYVDIQIYSSREYGGVEFYVGGTYYTQDYTYDSFVRRYNLLNANSRPIYVWDVIGKSLNHINENTGIRGTRSLSLHPNGDIIAGGFWTAPNIAMIDSTYIEHDLISHWAIDPSIRYRWEMRINEDGHVLWLKSNDLPVAAFITQSELYDTALSLNGNELWVCINDARYTVNSTSILPNKLYSTEIGSKSISSSTGSDYINEALIYPLSIDNNSQINDILFYSNVIDPMDNIISGGYYKSSALFSSESFIPTIKLKPKKDSKQSIITSFDKFGNIQYLMESQYGESEIISLHSDIYGNLYVSGFINSPAFFDSTFFSHPTSFLMSFSACKYNCNSNGICIFGLYGSLGTCKCNDGWEGEFCEIPICTGNPPCFGRGVCILPEICECDLGYASPTCEECANGFQPPSCNQCTPGLVWPECNECISNHYLPPDCVSCIDGWMPPNCDICGVGYLQPDCKECKSGYLPPYCNECMDGFNLFNGECISTCSNPHFMPTNCTTCVEPYAEPDCRCEHGYTGDNCNEYTCWEVNYCSDNGICQGPNNCFCIEGYTGLGCTIPPDYSIIEIVITNSNNNNTIQSSVSQSILLDASNSYDRTNLNALLDYQWDCIDIYLPDLPCPLEDSDLLSSEATQLIPAYSLTEGHTYYWKVSVRSGLNSAFDTIDVIISDISVPEIDITITPPGELYSSATILLTASSLEDIETWTWLSLDGRLDLNQVHITSSLRTSILQISPQTVTGEISLFLTGTTDDGRIGSLVETITIIEETEGYCTIIPYDSGECISTLFQLLCSGWHDLDGDYNTLLKYQWSYYDVQNIQIVSTIPSIYASASIYIPNFTPINFQANIISSQDIYQDTFTISIHPSMYAHSSLSYETIQQRLSIAQLVALNWPQTEITNSQCIEPLCALNILKSFSYAPVTYRGQAEELPNPQEIYDILLPLFDNSYILFNDTYAGVFTSILYDLSTREDTEYDLLLDICRMILELLESLDINNSELTELQDPIAIHKSILNAMDYLTSNRLIDSDNELRMLIREIVHGLMLSLSNDKYLQCSDPSITLITTSFIISVSRGTIDDLLTSSRISLSSKSATFRLPNNINEYIIVDYSGCIYWHKSVFSSILYPIDEHICIQSITELSIVSSDGTSIQDISNLQDDDLITITFPISNSCSNSGTPTCYYCNSDDLIWQYSNDCIFLDDLGAKLRYTVNHLTDFTLNYSQEQIIHNPITIVESSNNNNSPYTISTISSDISSKDSSNSPSSTSNDQVGIHKSWFWVLVVACIIVGALVVTVALFLITSAKQGIKKRNQSKINEFAMEMEEFKFDNIENDDEAERDNNTVLNSEKSNKTSQFSISNPIKKLLSKKKDSTESVFTNIDNENQDNIKSTLVTNSEDKTIKEESTYVFNSDKTKTTSKGNRINEGQTASFVSSDDNLSLFFDPDEEILVANPIQTTNITKSDTSRLVVDVNNLDLDSDDDDIDF